MATRTRTLPRFLVSEVAPDVYAKWLSRKAASLLKRDRSRGFEGISGAGYRDAIHQAVIDSNGLDFYTGERLDWSLISKYDNEGSKKGKHAYKAMFALLPTVDHYEASSATSGFRICAWRTNDAKHDLSLGEFLELCERVLRRAGYRVTRADAPKTTD